MENSGRRGQGHCTARHPARFSSPGVSFTHREERKIRRSLERKLLSDNGARLSRIERRLLRADHQREGSVGVSTFKAALGADSKSDGTDIQSDEVLWLTQKLMGRNERNIKFLKMRSLLENQEEGGHHSGSQRVRQPERKYHPQHPTRRTSMSRRGESRRGRGGLTEEDGRRRAGDGGRTTSDSDNSSRGSATNQWRSSPPPPARWAIRHGTVGQWLHEVAAPMVSGERGCSSGQIVGDAFLSQTNPFCHSLCVTCPAAFRQARSHRASEAT